MNILMHVLPIGIAINAWRCNRCPFMHILMYLLPIGSD